MALSKTLKATAHNQTQFLNGYEIKVEQQIEVWNPGHPSQTTRDIGEKKHPCHHSLQNYSIIILPILPITHTNCKCFC